MKNALELTELRKSFGKTEIIRGLNLAIGRGERHAALCRLPAQPGSDYPSRGRLGFGLVAHDPLLGRWRGLPSQL